MSALLYLNKRLLTFSRRCFSKDNQILKVALCGGGNAAHVLMSDLGSRKDVELRVWAPFGDEADEISKGIQENDGITKYFEDSVNAVKGRPTIVSKHPSNTIPDADVIVLALPSFAHQSTLQGIAPYVKDNAVITAMPGQGGFNMTAAYAMGVEKEHKVVLAGFNQLPWNCRIMEYGKSVELIGLKPVVRVSTVPETASVEVARLWQKLLGSVGTQCFSCWCTSILILL